MKGKLNVDMPISWAVPQHVDLLELLSDDVADTEQMGIELGGIITRWSSLTIDG